MLLFSEEFKPKIINEEKTETRRLWSPRKARPRIGALHLLYTRPPFVKKDPGKPFARVRILDVYKEMLGLIGPDSILAEGFKYYMDLVEWWVNKYGCWQPELIVDVVKFKVVEVFD